MSEFAIRFEGDRRDFMPGDRVRGHALWVQDRAPQSVEVRLFWFTSGKGDRDVDVVDRVRLENPAAAGEEEFDLQLPEQPWSFHGTLITLQWSVEILLDKSAERFDITVSPSGKAIQL